MKCVQKAVADRWQNGGGKVADKLTDFIKFANRKIEFAKNSQKGGG